MPSFCAAAAIGCTGNPTIPNMNLTPCRLRLLATKVAPSTSAMSSILSAWVVVRAHPLHADRPARGSRQVRSRSPEPESSPRIAPSKMLPSENRRAICDVTMHGARRGSEESDIVTAHARWEYLKAIYGRYQQARRSTKRQILDECCRVTGYHRKHAVRLLNGPAPSS